MGAKLIQNYLTAANEDLEVIKVANYRRDIANIKFREKNYLFAQAQYWNALSELKKVKKITPEVNKQIVTILQDISICSNITKNFEATIKQCNIAIEMDSEAFLAMGLRSIAQQ